MSSALSVYDLHVHLGESHVLQGISFDVPAGGVTALLGRNGVGKTTTIRAVLGLVPRSRGSVTLLGDDVTRLSTHVVVRRGVGYVPEDRDVFAGLTVEENLRLAERNGHARYDLVHELFPELRERAGQRAGTLSGGQQQMVAIARALLNENRLLLVDEPTKGLAPALVTDVAAALERAAARTTIQLGEQNLRGGQQQMVAIARALLNENRLLLVDEPTKGLAPALVTDVAAALERAAELTTILLVEQNLRVVQRVARDVVVLDAGRVVHSGPADELLADPAHVRRLLGVHGGGH